MRFGFGTGIGPFRLYIPIISTRRRRRSSGSRGSGRSQQRQRQSATYYTHHGCTIHHQRPDLADRCAEKLRRQRFKDPSYYQTVMKFVQIVEDSYGKITAEQREAAIKETMKKFTPLQRSDIAFAFKQRAAERQRQRELKGS